MPAGGWYCFNRENCDSRYDTMRRLMSSKDWPRTRTGQRARVCPGIPRRPGEGKGAHNWKSWKKPFLLHSLEPQRGPTPSIPHPTKVREHSL